MDGLRADGYKGVSKATRRNEEMEKKKRHQATPDNQNMCTREVFTARVSKKDRTTPKVESERQETNKGRLSQALHIIYS